MVVCGLSLGEFFLRLNVVGGLGFVVDGNCFDFRYFEVKGCGDASRSGGIEFHCLFLIAVDREESMFAVLSERSVNWDRFPQTTLNLFQFPMFLLLAPTYQRQS